jgi:hypothetical protein
MSKEWLDRGLFRGRPPAVPQKKTAALNIVQRRREF